MDGAAHALWQGVEALAQVIDQRAYEALPPEISGVTEREPGPGAELSSDAQTFARL